MSLAATTTVLSASELGALRAQAFSAGIVIERAGAAIYCFGRATDLELRDGVADTVSRSAVLLALADIATDGDETARPIAVGALPFRPDAPGFLRVPELTVVARTAGGEQSAVAIRVGRDLHGASAREAVADLAARARDTEQEAAPDEFELRSARPHADYLERVVAAVDEIRAGRLEKIVLAREVIITANRPLRQSDLLERLRSLHPSCTTFAVDGFVGATPELLVRKAGDRVESFPLAGTAARSGDSETDKVAEKALLSSLKERAEHRAVVDAIAAGLEPFTTTLSVPEVPSLVELRNVSHLGTFVSGTLGSGLVSSLDLLAAIHPTPAVAGTPTDAALEYLQKLEDLDRDRYAGAVGWMDSAGDGEWWLGIRSASVEDNTARLVAGAGIVADSDPAAELRETQLKLQAMLAAAVRP